jgi:hypothetical protein
MHSTRNLWNRAGKPHMKWRVGLPSLSVIALVFLWACSASSPSRTVSIAFTQAAPSSLNTGSQTTISTTVLNDGASKGADWSLTCKSSSCGSLNPTHTASGSAATFTAPAIVPAGNAVTITATASADHSQTVSATVLITGAQISIAFNPPPPASVVTGTQVPIRVTVSNDASNAGVDWIVTCGAPPCGSLNPAHTASDSATTFTAPPAVTKDTPVTISATASADTSKVLIAQVTLTPPVISLTQPPPASLATSAVATVSASILNDPKNLGVDWTVTCGSSKCGSFQPAHTASDAPTTYTAPALVPSGNTVTITATAAGNLAETVSATVTITRVATNLLNGAYAFFFAGNDQSSFFGAAGSILADGKGKITKGEEDFVDSSFASLGDTLSGTYTLGSDGRGMITLHVSDPLVGVKGVQTLSFVLVTSSHALIVEFDGSATSSGTLDLQNPADFTKGSVAGGYGFTLNGLDGAGVPEVVGGVLTADGNGNFSGTQDINNSGVVSNGPISGTYGSPDSFGRGTATLGSTSFTYYIVDSGSLKFVESDVGATGAIVAGSAFAQGGGSFSNASLSGNLVFTVADTSLTALAAGGLFTADGNGTLTGGTIDVNNSGAVTSGAFTGTYTISSNGRGTVTLNGSTGGLVQFAVYLTANQGVLLLELDTASFSIGTAFAQAGGISRSTFSGNYAGQFGAAPTSGFTEEDVAGQIVADGVSAFIGGIDINQFTAVVPPISTLFPNTAVTGTFAASSTGRFTGTLTASATGTLNLVYYVASGSHLLFVGMDSNLATSGALQMQQF